MSEDLATSASDQVEGEDPELDAASRVLLGVDPDAYEFLSEKEIRGIAFDMLEAAAAVRKPGIVTGAGEILQSGLAFTTGTVLWRCTDVGMRTASAIRIDRLEVSTVDGDGRPARTVIDPRNDPSRLQGPPYQIGEVVFDEDRLADVRLVPEDLVKTWKATLPDDIAALVAMSSG